MTKLLLPVLVICLAACSGSGGGSGGAGGGGAGGSGTGGAGGQMMPDAAAPSALSFRTQPHTLASGTEDYRCTWFSAGTSPDAAIQSLHPVTGPGVHHLALFFALGDSVQAERSCFDFGFNWTLVAGLSLIHI